MFIVFSSCFVSKNGVCFCIIIAPLWKSGGYIGFGLSIILSFRPSFCHSVIFFCFRSITWEQIDRNSHNFIYAFILTRSMFGLLHFFLRIIVLELRPLIYAKNFISAQHLEIKLTEFHQIWYMHSYWQDLLWECYTLFIAQLYQSYGPCLVLDLCQF